MGTQAYTTQRWQVIIGVALYLLQLVLHFFGVKLFGKMLSPFFILAVYLVFPAWYLCLIRDVHQQAPRTNTFPIPWKNILGLCIGLISMVLLYEELRKLFVEFADPSQLSDVIPQITALYERFSAGTFPYAPVTLPTHTAYPVYMPLHWMPVGIAHLFNVDPRWIGYGFLSVVIGGYGYAVARKNGTQWIPAVLACILPSLVIWAFMLFEPREAAVSYELVIGAYYLLLGVALYTQSLWLTTLAIILCLLSRYTLVFWLPVFAFLLLRAYPVRRSITVWLIVLIAILGVYVVPFILKDPSILAEGLKYHNNAAVAEWKGYGDPPVSWSFEKGIYFAPHFKQVFSGTIEHRVFLTRIIQGSMMVLFCIGGIVGYRFFRKRMHWMEYSLVLLYCMIGLFYFLSPLVYSYYFMVPYMLSALLCARIITCHRISAATVAHDLLKR